MKLQLDQIRLDGGTQPRVKLRLKVMEEYAKQMRNGVEFPPVIVFFDGTVYWLADGFHRVGAYKRARPGEPIEVEVIQGTQSDAQWYSYGVDTAHGLRRTNEDKERAVHAALDHPKAARLSNCQIAEHCGVSEVTVRRHRQKRESTLVTQPSTDSFTSTLSKSLDAAGAETLPAMETRPRTGRDGRTINTAKIGRAQRRNAHKPRSPTEFLAARREGYEGHVNSDVRLLLPNNNVRNCAYDLLRYFTFEYLQKVFQEIVNIHQERLQEAS